MVMPQKTKEAEITEQDSLLVKGICLCNISYIRGLFHEKYFGDKSIPALEMKVKKLMTLDVESRRLIDLIEKGVYDALQKKYLKTLLFCICEKEEGPMIEEYAFSFSYPNTEEVTMNMSRTGSKKGSTTFTSNASEVTPDQMRSSACKMIRTLVSLMSSLDKMPEEGTILMKLMYYDDVTPEDYEPPFFKGCADDEAINIWNKNPLKMEVGNVNSKHLVLALKVKSVLDPCDDNSINSGDDSRSMDNDTYQDDKFSNTEIRPSKADRYAVAPNDGKGKGQSTGTISEDGTQDAAHEEELTAKVKEWICSRETGTINVLDDILMEMVEGNERNKTRHYNWNNRPTFTNIITKLFSKKKFSSSASDSRVIKNFAVISLNGTRVQVAWSYIKGVIKFRVWNMTKGKSADISKILGIKRILYTVSSSGTFHFVLTHGDCVLGFVFDGPASWLHAVIKEDHSFQFLSQDPYIDIKAASVLDFTGRYKDLTLNDKPGEIPIGYDALINAFDKILAFKGVSGQDFKTALATIVVHLGEATKFHRVLLACCKTIIYEDFSTLDSIDKNLGLLVRKWGKFSEIGMKTILRAVANEYIPSLDEVANSIKKKKVPSVQTLRDILDNLCLYTHSSWDYHGVTTEIEDEESSNDDDSASAKEHKRNEFCPIDDSDDPYAEKTKAYYLRSMGYKYNAEVLNKKGLSSVKTPESDVATEIFERLKSEGLRYALKADPAKRHGMSPLFCASTWGSEIKLHHIGKSFSVDEYWKRRSASTTRKPAANSALSAMMKWRLFSSLARIMKNIK